MVVLINANDQSFGYAAIFCGMTTLVGVFVSVAPVIMGFIADRTLQRRRDAGVEVEKGPRDEAA